MMIEFENQDHPHSKHTPLKAGSRSKGSRMELLEQDLKSTQESLQTTIEELETSNEELKSANEELQSTNEELQSANEELETSKEELQSLNEELITVNAELQGKIDELSIANNDMKNLLDSTKIATIFLDSQFHVKSFTPETKYIINLIPTDLGRLIADISVNLEGVSLVEDAQDVLETLVFKEREVTTKDGRCYLMRTMPHHAVSDGRSGDRWRGNDVHRPH
jgi:two-component system CheB/CheR fusion protein